MRVKDEIANAADADDKVVAAAGANAADDADAAKHGDAANADNAGAPVAGDADADNATAADAGANAAGVDVTYYAGSAGVLSHQLKMDGLLFQLLEEGEPM